MANRGVPLVAMVGLVALGCDEAGGGRVPVVDLLRHSSAAERRPLGGTFDAVEHRCGTESHPSLGVPPASRVTWSLMLPDRAVLATHGAVAGPPGASAVFRVDISDGRIYEELEMRTVSTDSCGSGWTPIEVDLGPYSGWQFSLFYRPRNITWRLVLSVNRLAGEPTRAFWGRPRIESDTAAARRFYRR